MSFIRITANIVIRRNYGVKGVIHEKMDVDNIKKILRDCEGYNSL